MAELDFLKEGDDTFDLKGILIKYFRFRYWFLLALGLSLGAAFVYLQLSAPIFKITSILLIKDEKKGGMGGTSEILKELELTGSNKIVENEMEILKSRTLIEKVVDDLNLTVTYYTKGQFRDSEIFNKCPITLHYTMLTDMAYKTPFIIRIIDQEHYELLNEQNLSLGKYAFSQLVKCEYGNFRVFPKHKNIPVNQFIYPKFSSREGQIVSLAANIQVELLNPKSTVVQLSLENAVPDKGKMIIAKLLDVYTYSSLEDKNRESTNTLHFIEDRLKLISKELGDVEGNVEAYKTQKGITDLSEEANLFLTQAKDNDTKLNEVDVQLKVLEGVEKYLQSSQRGVAPATLMVSDPILEGLLIKLNELELEQDRTARTTQAKNPFLQTINTQVQNVKQAILENVTNQRKGFLISKLSYERLNNRFESSIRSIPKKEREFVSIKRQQGIKESLYLLLLQKREETALSYASTVTDSRIIDAPFSSPGPIKPNSRNVYLIGLLIGLLVPTGIINLKELLNDKVQSRKDITSTTDVPIFGEIALKQEESGSSLIDTKSRSFLSEQFRILRTNLQYIGTKKEGQTCITFLVTSSTSGEGKSFVSMNMAATIASLGKKVVLLELDLRKPKISSYLGIPRDRGISNFLVGLVSVDDILRKTKVENLSFLPSGPTPPNPAELLSNGKIETLLAHLKENFDYIIIDTPPIGLVTDSLILSSLIDTCFYIVRHEVTLKQNLTILSDLQKFQKFQSINIIFNGVNYKNSQEYRYGYGNGYGYGYGYGYYGDEKRAGFANRFLSFLKSNKKKKNERS